MVKDFLFLNFYVEKQGKFELIKIFKDLKFIINKYKFNYKFNVWNNDMNVNRILIFR